MRDEVLLKILIWQRSSGAEGLVISDCMPVGGGC